MKLISKKLTSTELKTLPKEFQELDKFVKEFAPKFKKIKDKYIDAINYFWFGGCYANDVGLTEQQEYKICLTMLENGLNIESVDYNKYNLTDEEIDKIIDELADDFAREIA